MDPCLPSDFARGVHVFQASSRRLPGKHDGFDNVNNVVWKTVADIAVECRQRIGGSHKWTAAFTQRLGRVARNLPAKFIDDAIGDLAERCKRLYAATGGLSEEGGRKKRRRPLYFHGHQRPM